MTTLELSMPARSAADLGHVAIDLYRDVHKGIRNELFAVTAQIGALDPDDPETAAKIAERTACFFELLHAHAQHEDEFIAPALDQVQPRLSDRVRTEHERLGRHMKEICHLQGAPRHRAGTVTSALAVRRWYLSFASFTSAYLAHEATEELDVMPALNRAMTPDALAELEAAIIASITPEHFAGYLTLILPASNPQERAELVGGIRSGAPTEVFEGVIAIAQTVLTPHDLDRLLRDLEASAMSCDITRVPSAGFEPAHTAPEADAGNSCLIRELPGAGP